MKFKTPICRNCGADIFYEDLESKECPHCHHKPLRIDYVIREMDVNDIDIEEDSKERMDADIALLMKHYKIDVLQEFRDNSVFASIWNHAGLIENLAIKTKLGLFVDINDVREQTMWLLKMLDALEEANTQ